jgi:hypothetical protein
MASATISFANSIGDRMSRLADMIRGVLAIDPDAPALEYERR